MTDWRMALRIVRLALRRRGHTEDEAEDLAQEAWMRLARYLQAREVRQPEAFLMRAAINLSIDKYRSRLGRGDEVAIDEVVLIDLSQSTESIILNRERATRLGVCLQRLSAKSRAILLSHRVDGLSYREIAQEHEISVTAVERHVAKATMLLACWMEGW